MVLSERGKGWRMGGVEMEGWLFFFLFGYGGSHGSAQSELCLVLMRSLFIKSTQGGSASA